MKLDGMTIENLTPIPVTVEGQWSPAPDLTTPLTLVDGQWVPAPSNVVSTTLIDGQMVSVPYVRPTPTICVDEKRVPAPCREWHGTATANEPFVAITLHRTSNACHWVKTGHSDTSKVVRLDLSPGDQISVRTSIGQGGIDTSLKAPTPYYRPTIEARRQFFSGTFQQLAIVDGDPRLEVLILFLARRDVRSTRNGLWRLRPNRIEPISNESIHRMLTNGRTGRLEVD